MARFSKFYAALSVGLLGWGAVVVDSAPSSVTANEWLGLGGALVAAAAVYLVPNTAS